MTQPVPFLELTPSQQKSRMQRLRKTLSARLSVPVHAANNGVGAFQGGHPPHLRLWLSSRGTVEVRLHDLAEAEVYEVLHDVLSEFAPVRPGTVYSWRPKPVTEQGKETRG